MIFSNLLCIPGQKRISSRIRSVPALIFNCYQSLLVCLCTSFILFQRKPLMSSLSFLRFTKSVRSFSAFLIIPYNCCFAPAPILGSHLLQVAGPSEQSGHSQGSLSDTGALHCFSLLHKAICLLLVRLGHYWSLSSSEVLGTPLTTLCTYKQGVLNPDGPFFPCTEYGLFYNIPFHSVPNSLKGT